MSGRSTENEIYVRGWFGPWALASEEQARTFAQRLMKKIQVGDDQHRIDIINSKHVRGITFTAEELHDNR